MYDVPLNRRWLFGDQLGRHFLDAADQPVLLIESKAVFQRRTFHRAKAHLVLSAMRHRARELGDQCSYIKADTYREALAQHDGPLTVVHPTSRAALDFVVQRGLQVEPARGFATSMGDFAGWAKGRDNLLMETFYRDARRRLDVLMDGTDPVGGQWNFDHDNREPPPKKQGSLGLNEPRWPTEDDIDDEVRHDLDRWEKQGVRFVGNDGPRRFAATEHEATLALNHFVKHRLATFGPQEDSMLVGDPTMSHSLLSAPMNLGLLDPMTCVRVAEQAYRDGTAPLNSVEGYIRQLIGWRDYVWHIYWHTEPSYKTRNAMRAHEPLPDWLWDLDPTDVTANCMREVLSQLRDWGWTHHIPRLEVLGNWALQRGIRPDELTAWFHVSFVDGYDWVMAPNVVGMSQHADGGLMATKPYAAGGAYINRMSNFCHDCEYDPRVRVGDHACPFTAGYWSFIGRHRKTLLGNPRMRQALSGFDNLADGAAVLAQEKQRGTSPP